jgi:hypothetical protein
LFYPIIATALENAEKYQKILRYTLRKFRDVCRFKDKPLGHSAIFEQDIPLTTNHKKIG